MKILIVEDDSIQREVLRTLLEARLQPEAKLREANDLKTAFAYLDRGDVDCIALDLQLPDSDGRDTFLALHAKHPNIPIVVMTNNLDRDLALDMIKSGAADYLIKNYTNDEEVYRRLMFAVERSRHGLRIPYDELDAASQSESRRKDPDAVTIRPHAMATIHVPEVGPKPRGAAAAATVSSKVPHPATEEAPAPPVEMEIPAQHRMDRKLEDLSTRIDWVLLILALLLVAVLAAIWLYTRRLLP